MKLPAALALLLARQEVLPTGVKQCQVTLFALLQVFFPVFKNFKFFLMELFGISLTIAFSKQHVN